MANYYVSANRGSDSTGVGTASSPWKTIGKAIGPTPAITLSGTGDVLFIEPGVYREVVTLGLAPTTSGRLSIIGDGDGAGFLAGGYSTPKTGVVDWRGWSDDTTPLTNSATLYASGKSYVTLQGVKIVGSNGGSYGAAIFVTGGWSDWTIQDCVILPYSTKAVTCWFDCTAGAAANLTFKRNTITGTFTGGIAVEVRVPTHTSEYDLNILVQNCQVYGGCYGFRFYSTGGGAYLGRGITVQNCTAMGGTVLASFYPNSSITLATKNIVRGCYALYCGTGLSANNASQVDEDYNDFYCNTAVTNITPGAHSRSLSAPGANFGEERLFGVSPRPFLEPIAGSPQLGFITGGSPPAVDIRNRSRPEGGGATRAAAGASERHDTGVKNVAYQDAGSPACLALIGPSSQERPILVNPQATTLSIKVRWDGNHGDASKPQATLLANPEIGVAAQTITATTTGGSGSTPNSYETLTFAPITPTSAGVVMLRMASRAAAGNGAAYFDTITLS